MLIWATHHFAAFSAGVRLFVFASATTMQLARRAPSGSGVEGWLVTGGVWCGVTGAHRIDAPCTVLSIQHAAAPKQSGLPLKVQGRSAPDNISPPFGYAPP